MPLGNGDLGLNVWVEKSGDLLLYLSKTDAWSDDVGGSKGLLKLGRIRVQFAQSGGRREPAAANAAFERRRNRRHGRTRSRR